MSDFFIERRIYARIISKQKKHTVIIKTEKEHLNDAAYFFEQHRPEGVTFVYKKLNFIDYWIMSDMKVLTEIR